MPFLLIDKPAGVTSHDIVDKVRRITGIRTVGHAGTLDPFATGLLIIGVERESTKQLDSFLHQDKEYIATIRLGETTDTLDTEAPVIASTQIGEARTREAIEEAMKGLTGPIEQIPPMHSAIKIGGKKLYELARKGEEVERPARKVRVDRFSPTKELSESITLPADIEVVINCSSGTYIRALARDLGEKLGTTAYLTALRRTKIGDFDVEKANSLQELTPDNWRKQAF